MKSLLGWFVSNKSDAYSFVPVCGSGMSDWSDSRFALSFVFH